MAVAPIKKILMMGTGPFAVPTLRALLESEYDVVAVVTRPEKEIRGRRNKRTVAHPMREIAESWDIPVLAPPTTNSDEARTTLSALEPDLLVVCDFGQILSRETIDIAPHGAINLHGSLLPKYRGAAPVNWAVNNGDTSTGVTVIHLTPKLDAGPCLVQLETFLHWNETAPEVEERLALMGAGPVMDAIDILSKGQGEMIGEVQDNALATKAPRLKKENALVDWRRSAEQIHNQVRAFKPWPGTYSYLVQEGRETQRVIFDSVSVWEPTEELAPAAPGVVVYTDRTTMVVATGDGYLSLDVVKPAGKGVRTIDTFLCGFNVKPYSCHFVDAE